VQKKTNGLIAFFALLVSACVKAVHKMLVTSIPEVALLVKFFFDLLVGFEPTVLTNTSEFDHSAISNKSIRRSRHHIVKIILTLIICLFVCLFDTDPA